MRESSIREAIIWMAEVTRRLPEKVSAAPMTAAGIASSSAPIAKPMIRLLAPVACDSPTAPEVEACPKPPSRPATTFANPSAVMPRVSDSMSGRFQTR